MFARSHGGADRHRNATLAISGAQVSMVHAHEMQQLPPFVFPHAARPVTRDPEFHTRGGPVSSMASPAVWQTPAVDTLCTGRGGRVWLNAMERPVLDADEIIEAAMRGPRDLRAAVRGQARAGSVEAEVRQQALLRVRGRDPAVEDGSGLDGHTVLTVVCSHRRPGWLQQVAYVLGLLDADGADEGRGAEWPAGGVAANGDTVGGSESTDRERWRDVDPGRGDRTVSTPAPDAASVPSAGDEGRRSPSVGVWDHGYVNVRTSGNATALWWVARSDVEAEATPHQLVAVAALLAYGADASVPSESGYTARDVHVEFGHNSPAVAALLGRAEDVGGPRAVRELLAVSPSTLRRAPGWEVVADLPRVHAAAVDAKALRRRRAPRDRGDEDDEVELLNSRLERALAAVAAADERADEAERRAAESDAHARAVDKLALDAVARAEQAHARTTAVVQATVAAAEVEDGKSKDLHAAALADAAAAVRAAEQHAEDARKQRTKAVEGLARARSSASELAGVMASLDTTASTAPSDEGSSGVPSTLAAAEATVGTTTEAAARAESSLQDALTAQLLVQLRAVRASSAANARLAALRAAEVSSTEAECARLRAQLRETEERAAAAQAAADSWQKEADQLRRQLEDVTSALAESERRVGDFAVALERLSGRMEDAEAELAARPGRSDVLRRLIRRMESKTVVHGWKTWCVAHTAEGLARERRASAQQRGLRHVLRRLRTAALRAPFNAWGEASSRARGQCRFLQWWATRVEHRDVSRAVRAWQLFAIEGGSAVEQRLRVARTSARLIARRRSRLAMRALQSWLHFTSHCRLRRAAIARVLSHLQRSLLVPAWSTWACFVLSSQDAEVNRARIQRASAAVSRNWRLRHAARAFRSWIAVADERRRRRDVLHRVIRRLVRGALLLAWQAIVEHVDACASQADRKVQVERTAGVLLSRWQLRHKARAFAGWVAEAQLRQRRRRAVRFAVGRLTRRQQAHCWATWQQFVARSYECDDRKARVAHYAAVMLARGNLRLVARALRGWERGVAERKQNRATLTIVFSRLRRRATALAWTAWIKHVVVINGARARAAAAEHTAETLLRRWCSRTMARAFGAWASVCEQRHQQRSAIRRVLCRIARGMLAAAWRSWNDAVAAMAACDRLDSEVRRRAAASMRRWRFSTAATVFAAWTRAVEVGNLRRASVLRVLRRGEHRSLARGWKAWCDFGTDSKTVARHERSTRQAAALMRQRWQARICTRVMAEWASYAHLRRSQRRAVARVMQRMQHTALLLPWNRWAEHVDSCRREEELSLRAQRNAVSLARRWQKQAASRALGAWIEFVGLRQRRRTLLRRVVGRFSRAQASIGWHAWAASVDVDRAEAQRHAHLGAIRDSCVRKFRDRTLFRAFSSWLAYARRSVAARQRLRSVVTRFAAALLQRGWRTWTVQAQQARYIESLLRSLVLRMHRMRLATRFNRWRLQSAVRTGQRAASARREAIVESHYGKAVRAMRHRLLVTSFMAWVHRSAKLGGKRREQRRVVQQLRHSALSAALAAWTNFAQRRRSARRVLSRCNSRLEHHDASVTVARWRAFAVVSKQVDAAATRVRQSRESTMRAVTLHWRHRTAAAAFAALVEHRAWHRRRRTLTTRAVSRLQHRRESTALNAWCGFVARRKSVRRVFFRFARRAASTGSARAFSAWRVFVVREAAVSEEARRREATLRRVVHRWTVGLLARAFSGWAVAASEQRRLRRVAARIISRMRNAQVAGALAGWRAFVGRRRRARGVLQRAVARVRHKGIAGALGSWKAFVAHCAAKDEEAARRADVVQRIALRWQQRLAARAFSGWLANATERRRLRSCAARVVARMQHRHLSGALVAWAAFVARRALARRVLRRCIARVKQAEVAIAMATLRAHCSEAGAAAAKAARHDALVHRVVTRWTRRTLVRCFLAWSGLATQTAQERERREALMEARESVAAELKQRYQRELDEAAARVAQAEREADAREKELQATSTQLHDLHAEHDGVLASSADATLRLDGVTGARSDDIGAAADVVVAAARELGGLTVARVAELRACVDDLAQVKEVLEVPERDTQPVAPRVQAVVDATQRARADAAARETQLTTLQLRLRQADEEEARARATARAAAEAASGPRRDLEVTDSQPLWPELRSEPPAAYWTAYANALRDGLRTVPLRCVSCGSSWNGHVSFPQYTGRQCPRCGGGRSASGPGGAGSGRVRFEADVRAGVLPPAPPSRLSIIHAAETVQSAEEHGAWRAIVRQAGLLGNPRGGALDSGRDVGEGGDGGAASGLRRRSSLSTAAPSRTPSSSPPATLSSRRRSPLDTPRGSP